ncbi:hypothetical protein HDA30_000517 [Micrococcus cohnii]|uniref:DUF3515 domain-containing protein n=1 Tax=Micrococcus cohnii TaxID=993416 RepID=A0A7W7GMT7_9MICC|nr:hypothetical protein [Micrococcus cohnii]
MFPPDRRRTALTLILSATALAASGCSGRVATVEAAPHANDPVCASAMVAMPEELGGEPLRPTDSQATAVWGDPAAVVLRCGVEPPAPTTDRCVTAEGVDWVVKDEDANWRITTYGRDPAVEVLFDKSRATSDAVMVGLGGAVSQIPAERGCVNLEDAEPVR